MIADAGAIRLHLDCKTKTLAVKVIIRLQLRQEVAGDNEC